MKALGPLLTELRAEEGLAGLGLVAARGDGPVEGLFVGTDPIGQPLGPDTLLPVASITKLATALAVLRLVDAGDLWLDDPLARHLPEAASARPGVTLRRLLSHSSGVPYHIPEDMAAEGGPDASWRAIAERCLQTPVERPPGTYVQYGNLAYGLLALVVERRTGLEVPGALRDLVLGPLGIEGYLGIPPRPWAHVKDVGGPHAGTTYEPYNTAGFLALGLPYAGLVTTAAGALALLRVFLGRPSGFLREATRAEATRNQNRELGGGFSPPRVWPRCPWGLGPELRDAKEPHPAPVEASPGSFGHGGATGCYAWADPTTGAVWMFHGLRSYVSGWMERAGPRIGRAILALA
ncbi:MAG TPA: serine hydrolase domain-containing protein [Chloroflexota bacterium]|nr:serine hydrolase domain-containing protein [Chloroflexota bacterium]